MTPEELSTLMADLESDRIERTISTTDEAKFSVAACAFANDFPGRKAPGYLLIGVKDDGSAAGMPIGDDVLQRLGGIRSNGNILPLPAMTVERIVLPNGQGDVAVITVLPADLPPVRYKGQCWIRVGPRRAIATEHEERILAERRVARAVTFDARPCQGSALGDLSVELFSLTYLPNAVAPEVIEENHRSLVEQLAALRFYDLRRDCPTNAGVLLFGNDPRAFLPGAYLQFVRYRGLEPYDEVETEQEFSGDLVTVLRELDRFVPVQISRRPAATSTLREQLSEDYPAVALRELLMNAVVHRSYEESTAPIRVNWFSDRVEIQSPGGLYGEATPENFPRQTAYRNPVLAEALKVLGYVNRFGRGVAVAQRALERNGNPTAKFEFGHSYVLVTVKAHS